MSSIWLFPRLPSQKIGNPNPRRSDAPERMVLHSTESGTRRVGDLAPDLPWPYHVLIDPIHREIGQLVDLANTALALKGVRGYETNHMGRRCAQVAFVGIPAKRMHELDNSQLEWTAQQLGKVMAACNVPNQWVEMKGEESGIVLATVGSSNRLSVPKWEQFNGVCFPAGTLVLTQDGLEPIESVKPGIRVLTHRGRWKEVTRTMQSMDRTVTLKGHGHPGLTTTADHPFLSVTSELRRDNSTSTRWKRLVFSSPGWAAAVTLPGRYWATPTVFPSADVPPVDATKGCGRRNRVEVSPELLWLAGRWVADGHLGDGTKIVISAHVDEQNQVVAEIEAAVDAAVSVRRPDASSACVQVTFSCVDLQRWLRNNFGELAHGKKIPSWLLGANEKYRSSFFDGYLAGDGHVESGTDCFDAKTVSHRLAIGMRLLASSLGYATSLYRASGGPETIQGRVVSTKDKWRLKGRPPGGRGTSTALIDGHRFSRVKEVTAESLVVPVYNLAVADDESYVADGIVVHNCGHQHVPGQDHWDPGNLNEAVLTAMIGRAATGATVKSQPGMYTVREGDTLSEIAGRLGVSIDALALANGIRNRNAINVGQQLRIPAAGPEPEPPADPPVPPEPDLPQDHWLDQNVLLSNAQARLTSVSAEIDATLQLLKAARQER